MNFDYELLDCGGGERVERFGSRIIQRPCPQAFWPLKLEELKPNIAFERSSNKGEWNGVRELPEDWNIAVGENKVSLKFSQNGQVGIFPEQFDNWQWVSEKIKTNSNRDLKILNTFAYTGVSTLFASASHTEVCHVDGAKSSINWAKKNAELSGLSDNKIRWICEDVLKFMEREVRRGQKYDGIILDPPAFGRGKGGDWKIKRDLGKLMVLVGDLLVENPLFVILTCHAPDHYSPEDFVKILENLPKFSGKKAEELFLEIPSREGNNLPSSFGARIG